MEMTEKNMFLGGNIVNLDLRKKEIMIDKDQAERNAFGEGIASEKIEIMEFEYFKNALKAVRAEKMEATSVFSGELKSRLAQEIGIDESQIKIFNADNTPLDKFHKVSAFVDINDAYVREGKATITLDVFTEKRNKRIGADVVFQQPECGFNAEKENVQYKETLETVVRDIAKKFREIKDKTRYKVPGAFGQEEGKMRKVVFDQRQ